MDWSPISRGHTGARIASFILLGECRATGAKREWANSGHWNEVQVFLVVHGLVCVNVSQLSFYLNSRVLFDCSHCFLSLLSCFYINCFYPPSGSLSIGKMMVSAACMCILLCLVFVRHCLPQLTRPRGIRCLEGRISQLAVSLAETMGDHRCYQINRTFHWYYVRYIELTMNVKEMNIWSTSASFLLNQQ